MLKRLRAILFLLGIFASAVNAGQALLSWDAPTTRIDGSALPASDIGGYRIYSGQSQDNLNLAIDLNSSAGLTYTFTDLQPGTYYFAATVYDVEGNESAFSNVVTKIFLAAPSSVILTIQ